jgi:hypothetical protein
LANEIKLAVCMAQEVVVNIGEGTTLKYLSSSQHLRKEWRGMCAFGTKDQVLHKGLLNGIHKDFFLMQEG